MRRGFGRPLRRTTLGNVPPLLQRANQLLSSGSYAEAASAFEQLARAAEARGGLRAPLFYIQAGRSRVMAGQAAAGMDLLERGLGLFAVRGQILRASNFGARIVGELNARKFKMEAQQLTDYLRELVPGFGEPAATNAAPASQRRSLPTHCPGCGAPLRADEVDWQDQDTAVCAYCGSPVHGEP